MLLTISDFTQIPGLPRDCQKDTTLPVQGPNGEIVPIPVLEGTGVIMDFLALHYNRKFPTHVYLQLRINLGSRSVVLGGPIRLPAPTIHEGLAQGCLLAIQHRAPCMPRTQVSWPHLQEPVGHSINFQSKVCRDRNDRNCDVAGFSVSRQAQG